MKQQPNTHTTIGRTVGEIVDTIDVMISVICILHLLLRNIHPHHMEVQFLYIEL